MVCDTCVCLKETPEFGREVCPGSRWPADGNGTRASGCGYRVSQWEVSSSLGGGQFFGDIALFGSLAPTH